VAYCCTCFIVRANHVAAEGRRSGPRMNSPATVRMSHSAPPMPNTGFNLWPRRPGVLQAAPTVLAHSRSLRSSAERPPQIRENSGPHKGHAHDTPVMTGQQWPIAFGCCLPANAAPGRVPLRVEEHLRPRSPAGGQILPLPMIIDATGKPTVIRHAGHPPFAGRAGRASARRREVFAREIRKGDAARRAAAAPRLMPPCPGERGGTRRTGVHQAGPLAAVLDRVLTVGARGSWHGSWMGADRGRWRVGR